MAVNDQKLAVLGNILEEEDIKDNTEVTLYVNDNENQKIEIPCILEKQQQSKAYELECSP